MSDKIDFWTFLCSVDGSFDTLKPAYFSSLAHYSDLQILLPAPFDGPLTQEKKSCILGLCVPSNSNENSAWECLNECICGLVKCSLLPGGTKTAPSLFRTLFVYFCFHNSEIMHNSVYRLITGIMKTSPHLTSYALSFLQSVKRHCKDSQFHEKVLGHLVEHILSIPMKQFCSNLEYYLVILESASQESASVCRPRAILRLLQKLLINAELKLSNVWSTGNDILSVCRSFLKYHDVQIFYYDLAEVLCLITQNIDDADVKDRAKIYYSMLTTLSKLKVQTIFSLNSSVKDAKNALSTFVVGGDAFQFACIQKLSHSVLQLVRLEEGCENYIIEKNNAADIKLPDVLDTYQNYLSSHEPTLKVPFVLKHVENVDDTFSELYSIIITTHSEPSSKEISVIEIPILKNLKTSQNKGGVTVLSLKPVEPYPLTLHFKAEFTCNNGCSYTCLPPSLVLNFEDLFMPLPVPESILSAVSSWRQQLFDVLWEEFKLKINSRETKSSYCQSSFCLKTEKTDFFSIVEQKWKAFIVVKLMSYSYNVAVYLPSNNHLLMKLSVVNDKPFVNIIVDNNNTLPWITVCLQNMSGNVIKDE